MALKKKILIVTNASAPAEAFAPLGVDTAWVDGTGFTQ
jgi:hypothetical protein